MHHHTLPGSGRTTRSLVVLVAYAKHHGLWAAGSAFTLAGSSGRSHAMWSGPFSAWFSHSFVIPPAAPKYIQIEGAEFLAVSV